MTTLAINSALASPKAFISFSMPQKAIEAIASDASRLGIALFLNGLIEDDMKKTVAEIMRLSQKFPNISLQIDPVSFEKYGIDKVPALVMDYPNEFDVFFGNYHLDDALSYLKHRRGA